MALVLTATAEDMVVQAIKRAIEERGVKVNLLYEYELVGVSRADAAELRKARRQFSSEQGYMEARRWIDERFADPEAPKKWLKERRPDIYDSLYPAKAEIPDRLKETAKKLDRENIGKRHQAISGEESQRERVFLGHRRHHDVAALRASLRREVFGRDGLRQSLDGDEQDLVVSRRRVASRRGAHHRAHRLGGFFADHRSGGNESHVGADRRHVRALGARRLSAGTSLHVSQSSDGPIPVFRRRISRFPEEMEPALADAKTQRRASPARQITPAISRVPRSISRTALSPT